MERSLARLEELLLHLVSLDPDRADPKGLTAELEAARAICEAVEKLA
ncbi:MAG: hypothetical protein HY700_12620 [Gemmatimonadetes bacterium]|nr:hypothetical protein [Gemmatimonadota bacterium]